MINSYLKMMNKKIIIHNMSIYNINNYNLKIKKLKKNQNNNKKI